MNTLNYRSYGWLPLPKNALISLTSPRLLQGEHAEAKAVFLRAISIQEKALGPDHPEVAATLNNLAGLLQTQVRAVSSTCLQSDEVLVRWRHSIAEGRGGVARQLLRNICRLQLSWAEA